MLRKRLLSLVGAVGLVTGLISSGVGAQAATALPDTTFNSLQSTYSALSTNGGTACIDNGTSQPLGSDGSCVITQYPGHTNVAICVENNSPVYELCRITQTNDTHNNYALVFQRYRQQGGALQNAVQYGVITQVNGAGSNLLGEFQFANQFTNDPGASQTQKVQQFAGSDSDPTSQNSAAGSNYAIFGQNSNQGGKSDVLAAQDQNSNSVGALNQTDNGLTIPGAVSKNFVAQAQFQQLQGPGSQTQTTDPRCCSVQGNGTSDRFNIAQLTVQWAGRHAVQNATNVGNCHTSGNCSVNQSSTQNGFTTPNSCSGMNCETGLTCTTATSEGGTVTHNCVPACVECTPTPPCPPAPCLTLFTARVIDRTPAVRLTGSSAQLT